MKRLFTALTIAFITSIGLTSPALAKDKTRKLYQIAIDVGATVEDHRVEAERYRLAFLEKIYSGIKSSSRDKVVLISAANGRNIWVGTARDFRNRKAGLLQQIKTLGYADTAGKDMRANAGSDLKAVFTRISRNEARYSPTGQSVVFLFSQFLDTHTAAKGSGELHISELSTKNQQLLPTIMTFNPQFRNRLVFAYWVEDSMVDPILATLSNTTNTKLVDNFEVYSRVESTTQLDKYAPKKGS